MREPLRGVEEEEGGEGGGDSSSMSMLKSDEASSSLVEGKGMPVVIHAPSLATRTGSGKTSGMEMCCSSVLRTH